MTRIFSIMPPSPRRRASASASRGIEPAVIERAAGDRAFEPGAVGLQQARRCRRRGEAAGGDDRDRHAPRRAPASPSMLRPVQHAVALDVGVDDRRDAGVLEALREIDRRRCSEVSAQPSTATLPPRASMPTAIWPGISARGLAARDSGSRTAAVPRMTRATPLLEPALDRRQVADAAAELHRDARRPSRMASTAAPFTGLPAKAPSRSTTCSHSKPCVSKLARLRGGIVVEDRRLRPCRRAQAHALAVLQVDRGKQDHGRQLRKLAISARPSAWLFSGWNCVPAMLSRRDDRGHRAAVVGARHDVVRAASASSW